jgi:hypothetical protein
MKRRYGPAVALLVLVGLAATGRAQDSPYQDLLRRLPDSTNVLVVADIPALRNALGVAPGSTLMAADVGSFPVMAGKFVMGAQIDLSERKHLWSIAMAQLTGKMTIQDVATAEGEPVDQFAGYSIVPTPRNAYFVEVGKDILAVRTPADRQQLKRWLGYQKNNPLVALPPYLLQAANPAKPALAVMAISLEDSLDPAALHRSLMNSQVMGTRRNPEYPQVENTILHVKGMTFTIQAGNPLSGSLMVDFDADTRYIRGFGKRLLLEVLQKTHLYVGDFDTWEATLDDRVIGISGPLSFNGLRKFGALLKTPAPNPNAGDMASYQSMSPADRALTSSKRYFNTVTSLLNDLEKDKTSGAKALAGWYDKYADQIDKLPILDVDPQLIAFSAQTTQNLRAMASSLNGISIESGYLQQTKVQGQTYLGTGYNSYYGGWNDVMMGSRGVSNYGQVYLAQDTLVRQGQAARVQLWQAINNETSEIRRQMTIKYKSEF